MTGQNSQKRNIANLGSI